jgi:hypothetical protein
MTVKLTHYSKKKCISTRRKKLLQEVEEHGLGEVVLALRSMYIQAYTHRGVLKNDLKWLTENAKE